MCGTIYCLLGILLTIRGTSKQICLDIGSVPHAFEQYDNNTSRQPWINNILSLNKKQYSFHEYIVNWCWETKYSTQSCEPFHVFLTGGAGMGKSHSVKCIFDTVNKLLRRPGQSVEEILVLVCCPTGASAYQVNGSTLHSTFALPLKKCKYSDYLPMSQEKLSQMRSKFGNLSLLILDECSMIGADQLVTVHRRLCDIMESDREPFGNVSILAVGDLLQLPPVAQSPI